MAKEINPFVFDEDQYTVATQDDGSITVTLDPALYEASRPEGLSAQQERAVDTFRQQFIAGTIENAAPIIAKAMQKDANITHATVVCDTSYAFSVEAVVQRQRHGLNPKTREPVTTYGSTTVRVGTSYKKVGVIKKACENMSERIRAAVGK